MSREVKKIIMVQVSVTSAEWNPSNGGQVIVKVANNEDGAVVRSTTRTLTINNIPESSATDTNIISFLSREGLIVVNRFKVY